MRYSNACLRLFVVVLQDLHCLHRSYHNVDHWYITLYGGYLLRPTAYRPCLLSSHVEMSDYVGLCILLYSSHVEMSDYVGLCILLHIVICRMW